MRRSSQAELIANGSHNRPRSDRNPLHYDEQRASGSVFGGIIVQGGVTTRQDGTVVLDGTATCWTADLAPTSP